MSMTNYKYDYRFRLTDWEGNLCDIRSDDCIDNECTNGATCRDGHRRYTCECPDGYTGKYFLL